MSLKKFEILEMIAKGGMAEVYRAKTTGFQGFEKEVCVKKILPHLTEDESFVTMFINEAKLAATLSFANVVSVHDLCISANGEYFIVMEFVNGKDLSDVIRAAQLAGGEIPPEIAIYVCRETCKGLHYAHSKTDTDGAPLRIIHRDVSPHNVLVSFMGEVKITDFGIAKASSIMNKTAVGILKGKYGYMSPEQARGQPLDLRSDIFNTGIVLYELLVGERCFAGSSDFSTLNLMRNAEVTPPRKINANIPEDLEAIVLKSLSADKNDRFQDAMELEAALAACAHNLGKPCGSTQVAEYMQNLFANIDEAVGRTSTTGILSLASVAGPVPEPPDAMKAPSQREAAPPAPKAPSRKQVPSAPKPAPRHPARGEAQAAPSNPKREAPRPSDSSHREADIPSATAEPGEAAAQRLKRRSKGRSDAKPPANGEAKVSGVSGPEQTVDEARLGRGKKASSRSSAPSRPAVEKRSAPAAETPAEAPAKARKPARVRPLDKAKAAGSTKKKGKQLSDQPKSPVGRRHLRPGLTRIQALQGSGGNSNMLVRAAVVMVVAGGIGVGIGLFQTSQMSGQDAFRDQELASREATAGAKPTVTVLIESEPSGATVRFDSIELMDKTPVVVERDRDANEHVVELALTGHQPIERKIKYGEGSLTRLESRLEGMSGKLKIDSAPPGQPVRIDGKAIGATPLVADVPSGTRVVEIGGGEREIITSEVNVRAGKTSQLSRPIPKKGSIASVRISSEPRAQIFVDGRPTGHWTNEGKMRLAPDVMHKVGLKPMGKKTTREVVLKLDQGEERHIYLDLTESS